MIKRNAGLFLLLVLASAAQSQGQKSTHTFALGTSEFLMDGKPFQIISGELHPARIPASHWQHRIRMARAMGCNTISVYLFWNYHEQEEGIYDFTTGNRDLAQFFRLVQAEGMWLIIRPGPYVCAEWDLGGIPPWLLRIPDIKFRCMDPRYMQAVERYIGELAKVIRPFQITDGGPLLMIQIENEYGSYGNDRNYLFRLRELWQQNGMVVPTFTGDGATTYMLEAGSLPGSAVGLDSGDSEEGFALAARMNPGVPVFSSETYPGWLTHWGEEWARRDTPGLLKEVKWLMDSKKSFNFYVIHGGTNFGYTAGANSGRKGYEPDVTSYDYDAPITEQGAATPKYHALRDLITSYLPKGKKLPPVPAPVPTIELASFILQPFTSLWDNLPEPVDSVQPKTFEAYGQDYGFILYKTELIGHKSGRLTVTDVHDYATVFLNGSYIGTLDRREKIHSIELPESQVEKPVLEILVEGMGRINFAQELIDRKGITDRVTLNGMTLMNWQVCKLPMDNKFIANLRSTATPGKKPGLFFKGSFELTRDSGAAGCDTYIDLSAYTKGLVWINGHNLGRYWNIGPQQRLYCPAEWLLEGINEIIVFDLHETEPQAIAGASTL
ncbi:MAG TPA: beta-galactosidase [bacterium]|nr:beta-galactosidase [bacterium]HOH08140.1 beta-galactosidase [bacterium]HOY45198.1 beta-galactosidase [bacterium]HPG82372.1 beta-galactosidase [bacterium]HPM60412.1 beta-galactosidase [bacterium]